MAADVQHLDDAALNALAERLGTSATVATEGHLAECAQCKRLVRQIAQVIAVAASMHKPLAPPAALWERVAIRTVREPPLRRVARRLRFPSFALGVVLALGLLLRASAASVDPPAARAQRVARDDSASASRYAEGRPEPGLEPPRSGFRPLDNLAQRRTAAARQRAIGVGERVLLRLAPLFLCTEGLPRRLNCTPLGAP